MERERDKNLIRIPCHPFRLSVAVAIVFLIQGFEFHRNELIITENSIGPIQLCQEYEGITLPFLGDTSSGSDGQYFTGRFYGGEGAKIMVQIPYPPSSEQKHIFRIVTSSSAFATGDNLSVGCTLSELVRARPSLFLHFVSNEYSDIFLEDRYNGSRMEFRLDSFSEEALWKLPFGQYIVPLNEIRGVDEFLDSIGNTARIREIAVVTGLCD
jgi:hypothetical protein